MSDDRTLGVRWTVGDVSPEGFEALRLSVWGAWRAFGPGAGYVVCVNTVPLDRARALTGDLPPGVVWHDSTAELPAFLRPHIDRAMAEGVGWKFAPLRLFPDRYELALDNDCVLWEVPRAVREWLQGDPRRCLIAQDVKRCLGQFDDLCGPGERNSGIRGLPPGFDLEAAMRSVLARRPVVLSSELDEQGLQVVVVSLPGAPLVVTVDDVSICSPFPPHLPGLGRCGAHFVGLNARQLPWSLDGRPASEYVRDHWRRHLPALCERVGVALPRRECA